MNFKVSIIIPSYNVENYIHRAIESSLSQSYSNIEVIIIDDGSTDNTWDVICNYCKKDKRIIAKKQINQGVSKARNNGISVATGDYCIFIDSDDWISNDCIKKMVHNLKKDVLISADCYYANLLNDEVVLSLSKKNYPDKDIFMKKENSLINFCANKYRLSSACYKIYDMDIIHRNNLKFDEHISHGEDGLFVYNYLKHCNGFSYYNDPLWYILDRPGSATTSKYSQKWLSAVDAAELIYNDNDNLKLKNHFSYYCCIRFSTVLTSAIISDYKANHDDIVNLRKKIRKKISGVVVEKNIKKILFIILISYFPIFLCHVILSFYYNKNN